MPKRPIIDELVQIRALLIDDDERLNALVTSYLERFGISVRAFAHPEGGFRALKNDCPDIVILDVMLPDIDGFTLCPKIREFSRVPIVMLTARGDVTDRIVGLDLGADDYLAKPFEPRELLARIQAVLRRVMPGEQSERIRIGNLDVSWSKRSAAIEGRDLALTSRDRTTEPSLSGSGTTVWEFLILRFPVSLNPFSGWTPLGRKEPAAMDWV